MTDYFALLDSRVNPGWIRGVKGKISSMTLADASGRADAARPGDETSRN